MKSRVRANLCSHFFNHESECEISQNIPGESESEKSHFFRECTQPCLKSPQQQQELHPFLELKLCLSAARPKSLYLLVLGYMFSSQRNCSIQEDCSFFHCRRDCDLSLGLCDEESITTNLNAIWLYVFQDTLWESFYPV